MLALPRLKQPYLWPFGLLILADGLLLSSAAFGLRYAAALLLLAFLPGWVWLSPFFDPPADQASSPHLDPAESFILAVGLSLALTICAAMGTAYLPGPFSLPQLLVVMNILIGAGLVTTWGQRLSPAPLLPHSLSSSLAILTLLLLLAAGLRWPHLGYAEFHEDEAEALMLGVRLMQGEDYALFLHRKGPAQMLLPLAFWLLGGQITEATARFPFALSSLLSVAILFLLGRRWFNEPAGAIAGLLWALNGYAIAFGRMVQYQALIFFLGPLALYSLYLAWNWSRPRCFLPAALLLAACLLAHFDALLLLPAAVYLAWITLSKGAEEQGGRGEVSSPLLPCSPAPLLPSRFLIAAIALTLFLALLAAFYIPYFLDPEFQNTAQYLAESRVKPGLLYNNLNLFRRLDQDYSSHFYVPLLVIGLASLFVWPKGLASSSAGRSIFPPISRLLGWLGLGLLLLSTWWLPQLWQMGDSSLAGLPWLGLGLLGFWLLPGVEARAAWLMASAAFIGYVFLVDDPRTHVYILYPGAGLLAGAGWVTLAKKVAGWRQTRPEAAPGFVWPPAHLPALSLPLALLIAPGGLLGLLIILYQATIFLSTESALDQVRRHWAGSAWEVVYGDLPPARDYFGYPKREGWKAVGALRAQGLFPGDFRSVNEDFIIPIWYNYSQARSCYDTPAHFFVRSGEQDNITIDPALLDQYGEVGRVEREGEVRLRLFSAGTASPAAVVTYPLETLVETFDQLATPQRFMRQAEPSRPLLTQFGPAIQFTGYDLPATAVAPGDILQVNLYWQALKNPEDAYRAFVHFTDGATLWGQQDDNPICRLPTSIWRAGQRGIGQFRLPINPQTPPGRYPLIIGLYQADTQERLKITAGAGQPGDDFLWLADVEVTAQ